MKPRIVTVRLCASAALLCCASTAFTVFAQQAPFSREQLITAAREIMTTTRYCALITIDARGRANARTMDGFAPDEDMIVWFGTNPLSRKVTEIRRNPRVTLYYFDRENQAYVTLHGIARLVNDSQEKLRHWKDDWKDFYPDRNKDYLLIEVRPSRIEVVNTKTGTVGKSRAWDPPFVIFPRQSESEPSWSAGIRTRMERSAKDPDRALQAEMPFYKKSWLESAAELSLRLGRAVYSRSFFSFK